MARKTSPEPARPYCAVHVLRPNGIPYCDPIPATDTRDARMIMGAQWATITNDRGWMPTLRVIRFDGRDITDLT